MAYRRNNIRRIPLSEPHFAGKEWRYLKECLDTGWVSSAGRFVNGLEDNLASYVGARYAVACVNGTSALHVALIVMGIGPGDEVIVPTVTFIAPINAVRYVGAEPVFMDCDDFLNIDSDKVNLFCESECRLINGVLINKRTGGKVKAILPVHVFGHPCRMDKLTQIARAYGLKIIEDAAESLGSSFAKGVFSGRKTGSIGNIGCFSFNGNKIITAGGGGMLVTNNLKIAKRLRYLTTQAKDDELRYLHNNVGYNYRLNNLQAAVGLAQMERLDEFIEIKRKNYSIWNEALGDVKGLSFIDEPSYAFSNYWFYSLLVNSEEFGCDNIELMKYLSRYGIETRLLWQLNHLQKPYRNCQTYRIKKALDYHKKVLNIPCSVTLNEKQIKLIAKFVKKYGKE